VTKTSQPTVMIFPTHSYLCQPILILSHQGFDNKGYCIQASGHIPGPEPAVMTINKMIDCDTQTPWQRRLSSPYQSASNPKQSLQLFLLKKNTKVRGVHVNF